MKTYYIVTMKNSNNERMPIFVSDIYEYAKLALKSLIEQNGIENNFKFYTLQCRLKFNLSFEENNNNEYDDGDKL